MCAACPPACLQISSIEQAIKKAEAAAKASRDAPALDLLGQAKDVLRQGPGGDL